MNIYLHELKSHIKSVVTWALSLIALILLFMSLESGFDQNTQIITKAMANFPRQLIIAFGMENLDWSTVLGFFALVFLFVQICLAVQAANIGFSLVSIEETELTADFLLPKPVSRTRIITAKLLAALTALTIVNLVVWITSYVSLALFAHDKVYDAKALVLLLVSILPFQLFFLTVGMVISLLVKRVRSVTPFSMALVFGLYILRAFGGMIGSQSLEVLSPFQHFNSNYIINNAAYDWPLVSISLVVIVISLAGSYALYLRRNMLAAV